MNKFDDNKMLQNINNYKYKIGFGKDVSLFICLGCKVWITQTFSRDDRRNVFMQIILVLSQPKGSKILPNMKIMTKCGLRFAPKRNRKCEKCENEKCKQYLFRNMNTQ